MRRGEEAARERGPVVGTGGVGELGAEAEGRGRDRPIVGGRGRAAAADGEAEPGGGVAAYLGAAGLGGGLAGVGVGRGGHQGVDAGLRGELAGPVHRDEDRARLDAVGDEGADERRGRGGS